MPYFGLKCVEAYSYPQMALKGLDLLLNSLKSNDIVNYRSSTKMPLCDMLFFAQKARAVLYEVNEY